MFAKSLRKLMGRKSTGSGNSQPTIAEMKADRDEAEQDWLDSMEHIPTKKQPEDRPEL